MIFFLSVYFVAQKYFELPADCARHPASINRAAISLAKPSKIFYGGDGQALSPELIITYNHVKATEPEFNAAQMIPLDMKPTDDGNLILSQVADKSLTSFLNSDALRTSSIGQAATEVEQNLKADVVLQGGGERPIAHRLQFHIQAFQSQARIDYTGFTNAALKYEVSRKQVGFEIFETIFSNKDLVLSHIDSSQNRLSELSLRWKF